MANNLERDNSWYKIGLNDGLQEALDIVNRASDYCQAHQHNLDLDIFDVLTRIITDIQAVPSGT